MTLRARVDKDGNLLPDIQSKPNPNIFNTIPYYPGMRDGQNIFQDARRRGLAGVIGGALDNLTMGATDFDRRGDSAFQKGTKDFLKSFIFGTQKGKSVGMPEVSPGSEEKTTTEKVEEFLDPIPKKEYPIGKTLEERVRERDNAPKRVADEFGRLYPDKDDPDFLDPRMRADGSMVLPYIPELDDPNWKPPYPDGKKELDKTTTQKVEEFLDPTGEQAEKRLDSVNIGGKDYKLYTDKNTGEEFIPFDPRISGNKGDFDRYGKPLTEEQKKLIQQGAMIGSFIPNPYTEEQMREIGRENLKLNL